MKYGDRKDRLKILTWHVHGNYLYYLSQSPCEFFLPVKGDSPPGYAGKSDSFSWGDNVHELSLDKVKKLQFDCILFQSAKNYLEDQHEILTPEQRNLPRIYLEHDPPRNNPSDTRHVVDDESMLIVHVTHFNNLMWNNNRTPTKVIEHGVLVPKDVQYNGNLNRGIVVINNLAKRGRRLGLDIFMRLKEEIPLDLVGMGSEEIGGIGEVHPMELPYFIAKYRFLLNPIRYTSFGLSVCEAMSIGMPVIALGTTEVPMIIKNDINGFVHTDIYYLIDKMKFLLENKDAAHALGENAAQEARLKFNIKRFSGEWMDTFYAAVGNQAWRNIA